MNILMRLGYSICVLILLFTFLSQLTKLTPPVTGYLCPNEVGIQIPVLSKTSLSGAVLFYGEDRYRRAEELNSCRRAELPQP